MEIQERVDDETSGAPTSTMLVHAVLVGLTPLIPVPILDDYVKGVVERRLVASVASARGVTLADGDVRALVDADESFLGGVAKSVLTFPLKLVFRKIFFVLELKRASDGASLGSTSTATPRTRNPTRSQPSASAVWSTWATTR
jgi:hypothetical protein